MLYSNLSTTRLSCLDNTAVNYLIQHTIGRVDCELSKKAELYVACLMYIFGCGSYDVTLYGLKEAGVCYLDSVLVITVEILLLYILLIAQALKSTHDIRSAL